MPTPVPSQPTPAEGGPRLLADHVVLDMLNTVEQANGAPLDHWQSDADVLAWLAQVGVLAAARQKAPKGLLAEARGLRELVRSMITKRKAGGKPDLAALNRVLAAGRSHLALHAASDGSLEVQRVYSADSASQALLPLAEATAELLAQGDFSLVRKCESDDCTLWFYDRTRSHRRRWCSMALCGNRHKVAAFRKREAAAGEDA
ncbi:CGNR zinc finger domain-containing protein [Cupriavidus necator]